MKKDDHTGSGALPPLTTDSKEAPPGYSAEAVEALPPDIISAFSNLNLGQQKLKPTEDECIAHLKLLEAISQLREDVGATDGLYGIFDRMAEGTEQAEKVLSKMREKRWAIYVVQASRRFEAWFQSLERDSQTMTLDGMKSGGQFKAFFQGASAFPFPQHSLPPLGK